MDTAVATRWTTTGAAAGDPRIAAVAAPQRRPMARGTKRRVFRVHLPTPNARVDRARHSRRGLVELAEELRQVDWEHLIADGTFCRAKKGALSLAARAAVGQARPSWC